MKHCMRVGLLSGLLAVALLVTSGVIDAQNTWTFATYGNGWIGQGEFVYLTQASGSCGSGRSINISRVGPAKPKRLASIQAPMAL